MSVCGQGACLSVYSYHLVQCKVRECKALEKWLSSYLVWQNVENTSVTKL